MSGRGGRSRSKRRLSCSRPSFGRMQLPIVQAPAIAGCVDGHLVGALEPLDHRGGRAVDELGSELDRQGDGDGPIGQDATANALACFENENVLTLGRELGRRRETGRARTDDDGVGLLR